VAFRPCFAAGLAFSMIQRTKNATEHGKRRCDYLFVYRFTLPGPKKRPVRNVGGQAK